MQEKPHFRLWIKILLLAAVNLAILAVVFAVFLRMQLRPEFESFLIAKAREKIISITALVAVDLQNTEFSRWDEILGRYSAEHGVAFLLYRNTGEQIAGPRTHLPPEVDVRMPRGGPPPPPGAGRGFRDGPRPPPMNRRGFPGEPFLPPTNGDRGPFGFQATPPGPPFLAVAKSSPAYWVGVRMPIIQVKFQTNNLCAAFSC